jgi:hypothetical protein
MEKCIKYRSPDKIWKMIDRKEFYRLVKHWKKIREAEKLAKAIEENE